MNLGETAKLIIQLDLKGNAAAGIKNVTQKLSDLNKTGGRLSSGFKTLGAGLAVAFIRGSVIAVGAIGSIIGAIGAMAKEGQEAQKVQLILDQAIKNSGKVSTDYVKILNDQSLALMNLSGMNDEAIKSAQTMLIQMDLTGKQVADITPLVLDFAEATGLDLETAAKLTGKSINGMSGALSRYGVFVDKARFKTDPYVATMEALNRKFGGTTRALSGTLEVKLKAFNEGLANIREEAGIKLLPALTRIVDIAGRKLVPAFAKFIDRILPSLIRGINQFADLLEGGGVEKGLNAITDAIGPMVKVLQMAVGPVKAIVSSFLKLPQKVQAALISGFILNKLSGGLVAQGGKDILGAAGSLAGPTLGTLVGTVLGKLGLSRGGSPATPLFVMDVQNRLPNGQFAAGTTSKLTSLGSAVSKILIVGEAVGLVAAVLEVRNSITDGINQQATDLQTQTQDFIKSQPDKEALLNGLRAVNNAITDIKSNPLNVLVQGDALTKLEGIQATLIAQLGVLNGLKLGPLAFHEGGSYKDPPRTKPGKKFLPGDSYSERLRPFASGEYDVPYDMPAKIHKGEMIIPSKVAKALRAGHYRIVFDKKGGMVLQRDSSAFSPTMFKPGVKLDASQITDLRSHGALTGNLGRPWRTDRHVLIPGDEDYIPPRNHKDKGAPSGGNPWPRMDPVQRIAVKVTTSTRDQTTAATVRRRWGPTPAQAGAA